MVLVDVSPLVTIVANGDCTLFWSVTLVTLTSMNSGADGGLDDVDRRQEGAVTWAGEDAVAGGGEGAVTGGGDGKSSRSIVTTGLALFCCCVDGARLLSSRFLIGISLPSNTLPGSLHALPLDTELAVAHSALFICKSIIW